MMTTTQAELLRYYLRLSEDLDLSRAAVIFRGPSLIDGAPIVVVAVPVSTNSKTGGMLQTYIIREDVHPVLAVALGYDASICGGCIHRARYDANGAQIPGTRTCYVNLGHGPSSVFRALSRGSYRELVGDVEAIQAMDAGRLVRLGTYGDPAAVPVTVWHTLLTDAIGHTGYTHQWRSARLGGPLQGLVMASCDNADDRTKARAAGWDTFTVVPVGESVEGANLCPASAEAGKVVQCADCLRCDGSKRADVFIPAHGATKARYTGRRVLPTL